LKKDEGLGLISLYVELDLVHHTEINKSAKQIWDTFHNLLDVVNTSQVNQPETELSNLKMVDFVSVKEYIARFKNLKANIITSSGKENQIQNM
jgi:hypothetical protein